ncbi:mandelate racemase/muconate lactonizing enzyme family protein [Pseudorhodobacter sp. W20_MBD10_FR17]|uniref:mandelate racemase/muconate lactonizing enzyme family protein n=1 Tax=Pseudorhodobacter sp. W20_MBD10_FR17 TaxID=3240266 RepID=UPI003F9C2185
MTVIIKKIEVLCLVDPTAGEHRFEGSYQNVVVVVHSDNGEIGIGESDAPPSVIKSIIEMPDYNSLAGGLANILTGQQLDDPTRLAQEMYDRTQWFGRNGVAIHAISALDIAIWDLFARSQGKPLHSVLGVKHHDRLPVYATIYPLEDTADKITAQVAPLLEAGFRHLKVCVEPWWCDHDLVQQNLTHLRAIVGPDRGLMLDVAQEFQRLAQMEPFLGLLQDLGFNWIEAPFPLDNLADHIKLKAATSIPLGVGDLGMTTCKEFVPYLTANAFDIAQPDLTMFGGLSEARKLASMLAPTGRRIIPHGYNTDITIAANIHFLATLPDVGLIEYSTSQSRLRRELVHGLAGIDADGMIAVPDTFGLGLTLNQKLIAETCAKA